MIFGEKNKMDIKFGQVKVSKTLETFFGENFRKRWNLTKYKNPNKPAVFFGLYSEEDIETYLNHKSKSIVIFGGADLKQKTLLEVKKKIKQKKSYTFAYPGEFSKILKENKVPHKIFHLPIKNFSTFELTPLGDKIYVYRGASKTNSEYYKWDEVVKPLIAEFGEEKIIFTTDKSIEDLKENYYNKCFVYVKPTPKGGCTTMFELGMMGRKTIGVGHEKLGNFIEYKDIDDLIRLIKEESKYIGQIRYDVAKKTADSFIGKEWLNLSFWENKK